MRKALQFLSLAALAAVILSPLLYMADAVARPTMNAWMLAGTALWFATVPLWMGRKQLR